MTRLGTTIAALCLALAVALSTGVTGAVHSTAELFPYHNTDTEDAAFIAPIPQGGTAPRVADAEL